jgi:hypothetical protein
MTDVYDVIVLGAGPVGQNVAARTRAAGLSVAVVERELVGGECSYWGCIPSKSLLRPVIAVADARKVEGACEAVDGSIAPAGVFGRRDSRSGSAGWAIGSGWVWRWQRLIRNPLGLSEHELLLETCDSAVRTLYCDISSRDALPADLDIIETTWRWNVVKGKGRPVVMQTCDTACIAAVEGHDLRYGVSGTDNDDNPFGPVYP